MGRAGYDTTDVTTPVTGSTAKPHSDPDDLFTRLMAATTKLDKTKAGVYGNQKLNWAADHSSMVSEGRWGQFKQMVYVKSVPPLASLREAKMLEVVMSVVTFLKQGCLSNEQSSRLLDAISALAERHGEFQWKGSEAEKLLSTGRLSKGNPSTSLSAFDTELLSILSSFPEAQVEGDGDTIMAELEEW